RMLAARDRQHPEGLVAVGAGDDRLDARHPRRRAHVDLENLPMRVGAAVDASGEYAGTDHVGRVFGASRDLLRPVHHGDVAANGMNRRDVVHGATPCAASSAAYFTASMIFT